MHVQVSTHPAVNMLGMRACKILGQAHSRQSEKRVYVAKWETWQPASSSSSQLWELATTTVKTRPHTCHTTQHAGGSACHVLESRSTGTPPGVWAVQHLHVPPPLINGCQSGLEAACHWPKVQPCQHNLALLVLSVGLPPLPQREPLWS